MALLIAFGGNLFVLPNAAFAQELDSLKELCIKWEDWPMAEVTIGAVWMPPDDGPVVMGNLGIPQYDMWPGAQTNVPEEFQPPTQAITSLLLQPAGAYYSNTLRPSLSSVHGTMERPDPTRKLRHRKNDRLFRHQKRLQLKRPRRHPGLRGGPEPPRLYRS